MCWVLAAEAVTELKWAQMAVLCVSIHSWAYQRNRGATAVSPHPPPSTLTLRSSLPPLPLPLISTFQHTDTVTEGRFPQWGTWSASRPAICPHCDSHIAAQWQTGITAEAFMLTEITQAVCIMLVHSRNTSAEFFLVKTLALKHAFWVFSLCVHSMKVLCSWHNANAPGFSCSDIWSFKENSTICEKMTRGKQSP